MIPIITAEGQTEVSRMVEATHSKMAPSHKLISIFRLSADSVLSFIHTSKTSLGSHFQNDDNALMVS
jgi:hypothetical protein